MLVLETKVKKYYSGVDIFTISLVVLILVMSVVSPIVSSTFWITNILYLLILVFVIYSYYTVYYQFDRKSLIIAEGKNSKEIFYREIVSAEISVAKTRKEVVGFTKKCIEIRYGKNGRNLIRISPRKLDEFYQQLVEKCKNLKEDI